MTPRFRIRLLTSRAHVLAAGCSASLICSIATADIVERPAATLSLVNDSLVAVVDEVTDLAVLSNDSISNAGTFVISVPPNSVQGGTLEVIGNSVRYTPPAGFLEGDTDSFEYTVTEEDLSSTNSGDLTVLSADQSALGTEMTDPGNGGVYTVTSTPGFSNSVWDGVAYSSASVNGNTDTSSLYRHIVEPDLSADIESCSTGSEPVIDVTVRWNLTKTSGNSAGYEASIARGSSFPLGSDFTSGSTPFVSENNWPSGETRELSLTVSGLSPAELSSAQFGLWAQDAQTDNPGDENDWLSNSVEISYSIDTTGCQLALATATTNITMGPPPDSDGDSILDRDDLDDDNDGIADLLEQNNGADVDTDNDGIVDRLDLDSDNDGILDVQESGAQDIQSLDTDGNGRIDGVVGSNGLADAVETGADSGIASYALNDSDQDGVFDYQDLDSDNDGVIDLIEAGAISAQDANQDSRLDGAVGQDGLVDSLQAQTDSSGYDFDNNGVVDVAPDTDDDGNADFRDLDSDDDGLTDLFEAGGTDSQPAGGDGILDDFSDTDGDGLDDGVAAVPMTAADSDNDGTPDFRDTDSDNDGVPDSVEGMTDADGDGIPDYRQTAAQIETGLGGGGCVMSRNGSFDPVLPLLALISLFLVMRRRQIQ